MEVVGSALCYHANDGSRCPAVFGRELVRDHPEFLDDLRVVQNLLSPGRSRVIRILTVDDEAVAASTRAIRREVCPGCEHLVTAIELAYTRSRQGKSEDVTESASTCRGQRRKVG